MHEELIMANIILIIPTYNERASIAHLLDTLEREFHLIKGHTMGILIVDGNSPDGTADIVRRKMKEHANIHLLVEQQKRGLGMAYVAGMKYAVQRLNADAFIEFDGDFQHDPKDIARLVAAFDEGYDYVIGSRYVAGGEVPAHWPWHRKMLSRFGSLFAKIVLRLPTNDNTSGLKLTRVKGFFTALPLSEEALLSKRYAYKIQFLHAMIAAGARAKEVPIAFLEREGGVSKSSLEDVTDSLKVVLTLAYRDFQKSPSGF